MKFFVIGTKSQSSWMRIDGNTVHLVGDFLLSQRFSDEYLADLALVNFKKICASAPNTPQAHSARKFCESATVFRVECELFRTE